MSAFSALDFTQVSLALGVLLQGVAAVRWAVRLEMRVAHLERV